MGITYYPNGQPYIVEHRIAGVRIHWVYVYDATGQIINNLCYEDKQFKINSYRQNNLRHNLHGPAFIQWNSNGQIKLIEYWQNNKLHNLHGPAYIHWHNGQIFSISYFYNGKLTKKVL